MASAPRLAFGIHVGQQNIDINELRALWDFADNNGFEWLSIWDHFYCATDDTDPHFEAVALMGAIAVETRRLRFGCMVFSVHYRNLGLLAKSMITVDHLSGGRVEFGLGAGWHEPEYRAFGYPFDSVRQRLDQLEDGMAAMRHLLNHEVTDHHGPAASLTNAYMNPRPVQPVLPLWVGGRGEKRTARIAARYADGWNIPYVSPQEYQHKSEVLDHWCEVEGRSAADIRRATQLGFYMAATTRQADLERAQQKMRAQLGPRADHEREGHLLGSPAEIVDRIIAYRAAGVTALNIAIRPPVDWDALHAFVGEVMPAFA